MEKELYKIFLRSPENYFDEFIKECEIEFNKPAHTILELKQRDNKKIKGNKFEEFCVLYLKHIHGLTNVWLLANVPDDILEKLKMKRNDMGIDIVAEYNGKYYAAQCKYKKYENKKNVLTWKALSTFYALCLKTGPWEKYIVMTNCDYVRLAVKSDKDQIICKRNMNNISKEGWLRLCNISDGYKIGDYIEENDNKENNNEIKKEENMNIEKEDEVKIEELRNKNTKDLTKDELRKLRMAYYDNIMRKTD